MRYWLTLNTSNQDFGSGGLVDELRSLGVNRGVLGSLDGATLVNGVTSDVHDTAQSSGTDRDHDGVASIDTGATTDKTFGT